ncbi:MAG TPA: radical SAM protein, partial [Candidatus Kapabacteria bacterium]|nr:radical SAM protein [Candidatus Kapabacteria bacterium]
MVEVLRKKEIHVFNRFGQNLAFDVNEMHLFEINQLTKEIFQNVDGKTPEELTAMLSDHFPPTEVLHVLSQLIELNLVGYRLPNPAAGTENPKQGEDPEDGIKRLVLFVSQACNLKCRYCYIHANDRIEKKYMSEEVAMAAVDLLFQESKNIKDLRIGFYGGEPMLQFDLIKRIIPYAKGKAEKLQKTILFTMTTNGTLLTDETIKFIVENNIHAAVSLDGNRE